MSRSIVQKQNHTQAQMHSSSLQTKAEPRQPTHTLIKHPNSDIPASVATQQKQETQSSNLLYDIYEQLFGTDELELILSQKQRSEVEVCEEMGGCIAQEIERLQSIEQELNLILQVSQNRATKMSNEDKWKMVVISYREKLSKLEAKFHQERRARDLLEETVKLEAEEKARLAQLNNIKFTKINALMAQKDQNQQQISALSDTISNLQSQLEQSKQNGSMLLIRLEETNRLRGQLTAQLSLVKEQSIMAEKESDLVQKKLMVLGEEEESINRQIMDLKTKYEIEIAKLENTVSNLTIERQEHLMLIDQLERKTQHSSNNQITAQTCTQTQVQTIKAEYYNSLADQLEESFDSEEGQEDDQQEQQNFSYQLGKGKQEVLSEGDPENYNEFEIPLGSLSASQHIVLTDRSHEKGLFERERSAFMRQPSFDECHSCISKTPSKYVETMGELTASLAQAYQKINELTEKVTELEGQKQRIESKIKEREDKSKMTKEKQPGLGYFSSFFKK